MCGRMTLTTPDLDAVAELLEAELAPEHAALHHPRYNVAPTQLHFVARQARRRELLPAGWGFATPRGPLLVNARLETAATQPLFRDAFRHRRCVVPADGFFEWTGAGASRHPIWFHDPAGGILLLGGLYRADGDGRLSFVVLTVPPSAEVAKVHDRMPLLLPASGIGPWLTTAAIVEPPPRLDGRAVSRRANSAAHDDPACLEPWSPEGQLPLI